MRGTRHGHGGSPESMAPWVGATSRWPPSLGLWRAWWPPCLAHLWRPRHDPRCPQTADGRRTQTGGSRWNAGGCLAQRQQAVALVWKSRGSGRGAKTGGCCPAWALAPDLAVAWAGVSACSWPHSPAPAGSLCCGTSSAASRSCCQTSAASGSPCPGPSPESYRGGHMVGPAQGAQVLLAPAQRGVIDHHFLGSYLGHRAASLVQEVVQGAVATHAVSAATWTRVSAPRLPGSNPDPIR